MGCEEVSVNVEGAVKVVEHDDMSDLLTRLQPQCLQRRRVVKFLYCSGLSRDPDEFKFNRFLLCCFLVCLTVTVISVYIFEHSLPQPHQSPPLIYHNDVFSPHLTLMIGLFESGQTEKALLAMFAAILAVGVLTRRVPRRFCSSLPPETKQVQTISSSAVHV